MARSTLYLCSPWNIKPFNYVTMVTLNYVTNAYVYTCTSFSV